ncbi:MAG: electron transfer flavoprotein subunit alpha/FixB family protein [Candidatus Bathyarchaeota archaeon]|jgi:electron transfer flavoprotein alpha subunit|nr:electron transfer flavoprotein subunit alpha/FixB family protein [Candidatus Bathyarchaeota archaeon]
MSAEKGIWIYSEKPEITLELLGKGIELAQKLKSEVNVILLGYNVKEHAEELIKHGADRIFLLDSPKFQKYQAILHLNVLTDLALQHKPEIMLIGATKRGKELAARLATRLETGCIPDCLQLEINEQGRLVGTRIVYGGNGIAKLICRKDPQIVTVPPRVFSKPEKKNKTGEIISIEEKSVEESKVEILEVKELESARGRLEEADIIICGGRGIEKKEDFKMLEELAQLLNAQIGNTRPLAEDRKWFSEWIGLSGKKIRPALYVGCGISGMIQHIAGMRDSKIVIAINKDPEAPIFQVADYIVIGDAYQIIPELTKALKKMLGKE